MTARDRPILFSGEMVRAILSGRKTQTRRIVSPQPEPIPDDVPHVRGGGTHWWPSNYARSMVEVREMGQLCPYGSRGDKLWVREAWKSSEYSCDEEPQEDSHRCYEHCRQTYVYYAATPRIGFRPVPDRARITYLLESTPLIDWYTSGWRPSIFMPRWASRLTLEITDVRVERLQSISEDDARAEGATAPPCRCCVRVDGRIANCTDGPSGWCCPCCQDSRTESYRECFSGLWDSLNAKRAPWSSNPWVWVISFKRLEAP